MKTRTLIKKSLDSKLDSTHFNTIARSGVPQFDFKKPENDAEKAVQLFLTGQVGKVGPYVATQNALVYRTISQENNGRKTKLLQNIIALKIVKDTHILYIGNSSILSLIGRSVSFGRERNNGSVTDVQTYLSGFIQMIPFSVFIEASLDLTRIEILERGHAENVIRQESKYDSKLEKEVFFDVSMHFTGASLFKVEDRVFLFDIDRKEIQHKIFNAFLVQLKNNEVNTITEAYTSLKPQEVLDAESKGIEVLRQGEWFLIKSSHINLIPVSAPRTIWNKTGFESLELRAGNNRPNHAEKHCLVDGVEYVSGKMSHSGREHKDLHLKGWYRAIPNTSIQSFTLRGDID